MDESGTGEAVSHSKVASGRRVAGATKYLVNARGLELECAKVLHELLLVPVPMYSSETMILRKRSSLGLGLYRWTNS